jgi:hypothetical protein
MITREQARIIGNANGVGFIRNARFIIHTLNNVFNGVTVRIQIGGDFLARRSLGKAGKRLKFPSGKVFRRLMIGRLVPAAFNDE